MQHKLVSFYQKFVFPIDLSFYDDFVILFVSQKETQW